MRLLVILLAAAVLVAFVACDSATTNVGSDAVDSGEKADIELVDFEWARTEFGGRALVGTVRNNSDRNMSYVSIEFELLDAEKSTVGTAVDLIGSLRAGGTWRFNASVLEDRAASARISDITAIPE